MDREKNIVITSRIRLARNLKNFKFPTKMNQEEANDIINNVENAIKQSSIGNDFKLYTLKSINDTEKNVLIEKHLISPYLAENKDIGAFLLSKDEKTSIMINEEDHMRIQVLGKGMCLNECWNVCNQVDDIIEEKLYYAFDQELGYITSCPTNIGTGMRASVMLHLPALSITNQSERLLNSVSQLGVAVRGVYGEGTKSMGHIYQISNQGTLGSAEEVLIEKINQIAVQIIEKERIVRKKLIQNNKDEIEDEVYRAYGILTYAKIMSTDEAMKLISLVKLGRELEIISLREDIDLYELMVKVQPNNIQITVEEELSDKDRDIKRAEIIKNEFMGENRLE